MRNAKRLQRGGFALIEALILIVVVGVAIGALVPAVYAARQGGAKNATMMNLSKCAVLVHMAHDVNKAIPPFYGDYGGKKDITFHAHLLGGFEVSSAEAKIWKKDPIDGQSVIPNYLSELDPTRANNGAGAVNFAVNFRLFCVNGGVGKLGTGVSLVKLKIAQIQDGASNTLLFATKYQNCGKDGGSMWLDPGKNAEDSLKAATFGVKMDMWQKSPTQANCNPKAGTAVSFNEMFIHVALFDASVRTVAVGISQQTWQAVHTYAAADPIGADWPE